MSSPEPTEDRAGDRAAVEAANAEFYAAFERADIDAMTALWLDGPGTLCIHPGAAPLQGEGAINRSWALIMANVEYIQFVLTDLAVDLPAPDVASVTCTENVLTADESTNAQTFLGGKAVATNVFVRREGRWRLWIHHASPVVSEAQHDQ